MFVEKLSDLVEVWCDYNKNNIARFFMRHGVVTNLLSTDTNYEGPTT